MVMHGKPATYTNHKCRCAECTEAWRIRGQRRRKQRAEQLAADPTAAEHGKSNTYLNWACRCQPCTAAHSAQKRERNAR